MKYLFTLFSLGIAITASGQEGYLINLKGDSIFGKIDVYRATYYDGVNVKNETGKQEFKAFQIQSLKIGSDVYEPVNYRNRKVIGKVLSKGALSYYEVSPTEGAMFSERIIYKNGEALLHTSLGFRKRMVPYLSDCETVASKIQDKELGFADIEEIMRLYNQCDLVAAVEEKEDTSDSVNNEDLANFSQLLLDITTKLKNGEEVPNYMIEALSKYSEISIDDQVDDLLRSLKKN